MIDVQSLEWNNSNLNSNDNILKDSSGEKVREQIHEKAVGFENHQSRHRSQGAIPKQLGSAVLGQEASYITLMTQKRRPEEKDAVSEVRSSKND